MGPFGEALYDALFPITEFLLNGEVKTDEEFGWPLAHWCASIGVMFDDLWRLVRDDPDDGTPGWSKLLDVDRTPDSFLPWLSQFVGVDLTQGADADQWRDEIRNRVGEQRGRPARLIAAAREVLSDPLAPVTLLEKEGVIDPDYEFTMITYTDTTPDPAAVVARVTAVKPGGLLPNFEVFDGWTIGDWEDFYAGRTIGDWEDEFATIGDWEDRTP